MKGKSYIVTAYRFGDINNHSYTLGVFTKKHKAIYVAQSHCQYRGGKYICAVDECNTDHFDNEDDEYTKEIYRSDDRS